MKILRSVLAIAVMSVVGMTAVAAKAAPQQPIATEAEGHHNSANLILGKWSRSNQKNIIEIQRNGKIYSALVVKNEPNPATDNKLFMRGLLYDTSHNVWNGEVFAVKRGEYVPVILKMKGTDTLMMTAGTGMLSKELVWARNQ
jgi:uncharacterized protein (DUF2147 family)